MGKQEPSHIFLETPRKEFSYTTTNSYKRVRCHLQATSSGKHSGLYLFLPQKAKLALR